VVAVVITVLRWAQFWALLLTDVTLGSHCPTCNERHHNLVAHAYVDHVGDR
jgi:hypothetical protein